jgi:hypothetical protein
MFPLNQIIVSFKNYNLIKDKYPNRKVDVDIYCPYNHFYYFNKKDRSVRMVTLPEYSIWKCDHEKGWPYMTKLRKGKI